MSTTLEQALSSWNSDKLKNYLPLLSSPHSPTRKAERIAVIAEQLLNPDNLRRVWNKLDSLSQRAVSQAYHHGGSFDRAAFVAQYGELPQGDKKSAYSWSRNPILFDLFVIDGAVPTDLLPLLADFAMPLESFQLEGSVAPPEEGPRGKKIVQADTELVGRTDLLTYLQLVEQGSLTWSAKTKQITAASLRKLYQKLMAGDFEPQPSEISMRTVIRPFGLDIFAQGAGLVNGKGQLSKLGRDYLQTQDPALLLTAFEKWAETGDFDELTRITHLNGLKARDTRLTPPASRRTNVIEALSWCPTGVWIPMSEFFRALKIWQFDFDVEATPYHNLYAGPYRQYGEMYGEVYWLIVKGLYIHVVIMEYLATIGAVDIIYGEDEEALFLPIDNYYTDAPFCQHERLLYFRINPWGAYLLGQAETYLPSLPPQKELFVIDDQLQLRLLATPLPHEQLLLEAVAEPVAGQQGMYQLTMARLLTAVESGQKFAYLADFLKENHQGALPSAVATWLAQVQENMQVFREGHTAVVIHLKRPDARQVIEEDATLSQLCRVLDDTAVLVASKDLNKVRQRLKTLGYLLQ